MEALIEARPAEDARGETGRRQGSVAIGGSEPDREHQERGRAFRPTHASFFSGVGGLDIGLEAAGWRTVSFSEIDTYASAVLARHRPGVPNLGDITSLVGDERTEDVRRERLSPGEVERDGDADDLRVRAADADWQHATLWTGGFPCTDLSIAGKRAGLHHDDGARTRSGLAFAFLDLVERHRPEVLLMENVYGLYSSNAGRDLGSLIRQMDELGYVGAWRGLDAQWFGVPQRRKRVFILAFDAQRHPDPDGPGTVLAIGTRCGRDHPKEREAWATAASGTGRGAEVAGTVPAALGHHGYTLGQEVYQGHIRPVLDGTTLDARGVRASDGLAGWLDRGPRVASALDQAAGGADDEARGGRIVTGPFGVDDDPLLPKGLDSNRYRCIGNGVVAPVAHWIGLRLMRYLEHAASSRD